MTNQSNVVVITDRLIAYLRQTNNEYIRSDLVAKITQLAERFAPDNQWFIQTMNAVFELGEQIIIIMYCTCSTCVCVCVCVLCIHVRACVGVGASVCVWGGGGIYTSSHRILNHGFAKYSFVLELHVWLVLLTLKVLILIKAESHD